MLNNFLLFVLISIDINISDFITNWSVYAFNPYTSIFGNITWGIMFGFFTGGVYVTSKSQTTTFALLVVMGIVFAIILPQALVAIFALVVVFIGTIALYVAFVTTRHN